MLARICVVLIVGLSPVASIAQNFPEKPLRMIVPFPAGAATDMMSRLIARKLQEAGAVLTHG